MELDIMLPPAEDHNEIQSKSCPACYEDITESSTPGSRTLFCTTKCEEFSRDLFSRLEEHVSSSSSSNQAIFEVPSEESQNTVNLLQHALQSSRYRRHHRRLRRLVLRTSLHCEKLPSSLFLRGVRLSLSEESHGSGSFADIYRGEFDGKDVALKRLRIFQMIEESKKNRIKQAFYHECLIWHNLDHRHVLPLLGVDNASFQRSLCMVLPWMGLGNIRHATDYLKTILTTKEVNTQILNWIHEVSLGLEYLHTEEIVHGDLRGPNILIDDERKVRLTDFGLAVFAEGASRNYASTRGGNVRWLAPELINPEQFGLTSDRPTYTSDIFSMGCVCVELCTTQAPYHGISDTQITFKVLQGMRPSRPNFIDGTPIPDALWSTVMLCWKEEPSHRPTAVTLVEATKSIISQREVTPFPGYEDTQAGHLNPKVQSEGGAECGGIQEEIQALSNADHTADLPSVGRNGIHGIDSVGDGAMEVEPGVGGEWTVDGVPVMVPKANVTLEIVSANDVLPGPISGLSGDPPSSSGRQSPPMAGIPLISSFAGPHQTTFPGPTLPLGPYNSPQVNLQYMSGQGLFQDDLSPSVPHRRAYSDSRADRMRRQRQDRSEGVPSSHYLPLSSPGFLSPYSNWTSSADKTSVGSYSPASMASVDLMRQSDVISQQFLHPDEVPSSLSSRGEASHYRRSSPGSQESGAGGATAGGAGGWDSAASPYPSPYASSYPSPHASPYPSPYPSPHASPYSSSSPYPSPSAMSQPQSDTAVGGLLTGAEGVGGNFLDLGMGMPSMVGVANEDGTPKMGSGANATTSSTTGTSHKRRKELPNFACPVPGCGSTFTRQFNLKGHLRSHSEEKLFQCKWPGCGKGFARQHDCKRHEQLHFNTRLFQCEGCKKNFARMDALNRHLRSEGGAECRRTQEEMTVAASSVAEIAIDPPSYDDTGVYGDDEATDVGPEGGGEPTAAGGMMV